MKPRLPVFLGSALLLASFSGVAMAQSLTLWGPTSNSFYQLPVGESIVLVASVDESQSPQLKGYKTDQLNCYSVPISYQGSDNNNAKWECKALKKGTGNSELFITVGSDPNRSDTIVIQVEDAKPTVHSEDLQLWGPSSDSFYLLPIGKTIVLTAGAQESLSPKLEGYKTDQLSCRSVPASYQGSDNNNAKWECKALNTGNSNSELFITIGSQRSDTIVIQVTANQDSSSTFGSCAIIQVSQEGTTYKYEIWNSSKMEKDAACQMDRARVQVTKGDARVTTSDADSMTVTASSGAKFTVFADKGSQSISRDVQVLDGTSQDCTISSSVQGNTVRFDIKGVGGASQMYCHFDGNSYDLLSGDAKLIEMTEFSLTFDAMKMGRIRVLAASPSTYSVEYEINSGKVGAPSSHSVPPAGYEDEVLVNFSTFTNPFPDTNLVDLSGKAAAELYRRAIIGGFPDGEFKGGRPVNRAEAAKFLLLGRFQSVEEVSNNGRFPDVLDKQWYTRFVVTAAQKGIISGYPDGLFRPADQVNTVEFLKMLSLTFGLQLNLSYNYNDVPSGSWFAQYAGIAQKYNLFPNRTSQLQPEKPLSREEVAIAIYHYLSQR